MSMLGAEKYLWSRIIDRNGREVITKNLEKARRIFPLTWSGLFVLVICTSGLWFFGFKQHDLVWYVAAVSALALLLLSLLSVVLAYFYVKSNAQRMDTILEQQCVTDIPWRAEIDIPNFKYLPLLNLRLDWKNPGASLVELQIDDDERVERISVSEHGDFKEIVREITLLDALGLASMTLQHASPASLAVMPNKGNLVHAPWAASLNRGEDLPHPTGSPVGDRLELRRYQAGDPARFIHWKAFARTGKLMQREPERSLSTTHRTAAYLVAGQGDQASAAAALTVLEANALGIDWVFGADGMPTPLETKTEVEAAVRFCASQKNRGGEDLDDFINEVNVAGQLTLMLFVPSIIGDWLEKITAIISRSNIDCTAIVGIDGIFHEHCQSSRRWWNRILIEPREVRGVDAQALSKLVSKVETAGARVIIANRANGRLLNRHQLLLERGNVEPKSPNIQAANRKTA